MPANTLEADVNEILLGYYILGGKWVGFEGSGEAKKQLNQRKSQIGESKYSQQSERAKVMANVSLEWAAKNGIKGKPAKVWWTARPGILAKAVGKDVDSRKNPTDILVQFSSKAFLGLSAKSTQTKGDIGFKNPGVGTVEKVLNVKLNHIAEKAVTDAIKKFKLSSVSSTRKAEIRKNPKIQQQTTKMGEKVLHDIRDALFKKFNSMSNAAVTKHVLDEWMDATKSVYPPYIKVTGMGSKAPFTAKVEDPTSNAKLTALSTKPIKLEKVGNDSIGVSAGPKRILKMRAKYESEKLASTIKFSGDPWK